MSNLERQIGDKGLSVERRLMMEALQRLDQVPLKRPDPVRTGRLLFGLDLTGSRSASLKSARRATAAMFDTIKAIGSIAVKLIYYRDVDECRATKWHDDPQVLSDSMRRLSCEFGGTQIARLLKLALAEKEKVSGLVFIGDHCEDGAYELALLAEQLGKKAIPVFVFHECADNDQHSVNAKPVFKRLAELSGGVYCEFRPESDVILRELLLNVAAFTTAGHGGVSQIAPAQTTEGRQLQSRLLLLAGAKQPPSKP
jgi:hypothetical protein